MVEWSRGRYLRILPGVVAATFLISLLSWFVQTRLAVAGIEGRAVLGWEWTALLLTPFSLLAVEPRLTDFEGARRTWPHDAVGGVVAAVAVPAGLLASFLVLRIMDGNGLARHEQFGFVLEFEELYTGVATAMVLLNAVTLGCVSMLAIRFLGTVAGVLTAWGMGLAMFVVQGLEGLRSWVPLQDDPANWSIARATVSVLLATTAIRAWAVRGNPARCRKVRSAEGHPPQVCGEGDSRSVAQPPHPFSCDDPTFLR